MGTGSPAVDEARHIQQRYALEFSLDALLDMVLEDVAERVPFERLVAVAGFDGRVYGRGLGVSRDDVDRFVSEYARLGGDGRDRGLTDLEDVSPLDALASWRSRVFVPASSTGAGFVTGVAVESDQGHPRLSEVRGILDLAAPFLSRAAEIRSLRLKVSDMEAHRLRASGALDALPDPVLVMDQEGRILLANSRAEHLLLVGPSDSGGRRHAVEKNNLFFSAFRSRALLDLHRLSGPGELLLVDPSDGSDLFFEAFALPFEVSEEPTEDMVFVLRDITDLRQVATELEVQFSRSVAAEHKARRESERLNVIIENAGVPIFVTDRQAKITLMNSEAERLVDTAQAGPPSSPRNRDMRANATKLSGFLNEFVLQPGLRREKDLTLVDPEEAREFPVRALSTKILDEHYEPNAIVTVLHDLTQEDENRHLAEQLREFNTELEQRVESATKELAARNAQLEDQREELLRASRLKSEFLATMSHELRTPINAILGYNSLLQDGLFGKISDKQREGLERMGRAAGHLLSLINDILDLSRVEAGKVRVNPGDIELHGFVEKVSESVRIMVAEKGLSYEAKVAPELTSIRSDETRLRQVVLNLISNAVKFTDSGSVMLRVDRASSGDGVRFDVVDTGIGIAESEIERIFDEFTQVDQSETREHGGVGLGLAISRKLVKLLGGTLSVCSVQGRGSIFSVEIPASPSAEWGSDG